MKACWLGIFAGTACALSLPRLASEWQSNSLATHVPIVLAAAGLIALHRWRMWGTRHCTAERAAASGGLRLVAAALVVIAFALLLIDLRLREPMCLALGLWLGAMASLCCASPSARRQWGLPLVLMLWAIPLPQFLTQLTVHHTLQTLAATCAAGLCQLVGMDVAQAGTTLAVGGGALDVAEPCSGYRFVMMLSFAAAAVGGMALPGRPRTQGAMVLASVLIAIAANAVRLALGAAVFSAAGEAAALAFLHGPGAWVVYAMGVGQLVLLAKLLRQPQGGGAGAVWQTAAAGGTA